MKEIIHKSSFIAMWVFTITNFLTVATIYWYVSMILWGSAEIIWLLTGD